MKRLFIILAAAVMAVGTVAENKVISPTICGITVGQTTSSEIQDKMDPSCELEVIDVQDERRVYVGKFNVEGFQMSVMSVELANDTIFQINFYENSPYNNYWKLCKEQAYKMRDKYADYAESGHSSTNLDSGLLLSKTDGTTIMFFMIFHDRIRFSLINRRIHERMHQKMMDDLQRAAKKIPEGHLKFKGVEIDGSPQEFMQKLKSKGFTYVGKESGSDMLLGDFAGFKNCVVGVASSNNKVAKVAVIIPDETNSWKMLYGNYLGLKEMLTAKYGEPSVDKEEWQGYNGKPNDDNSCMHELRMNRATIGCYYETTEGNIELTILYINGVCGVMLTYYDAINYKQAVNNAMDDL